MADDPNNANLFDPNSNENESGTGDDTGSGGPLDTSHENASGSGDLPPELYEWVGEGKKFSSLREFAKAYGNAQEFIDQLKEENKGMREELKNSEKLDQVLSRIGASDDNGRPSGESTSGETPSGSAGQSGEANITEETLRKAVQNEVTRLERERTSLQNENEASRQVIELAGGDQQQARKMISDTAEELGVTTSYLREQAKTSPTAFYRLVQASQGGATQSSSGGSSGSGQRSEAFEGKTKSHPSGAKPWSHWKKAKKEMSKAEYFSPSVQNEIMRSRQQLGDDFWDTNA